MKELGFFFMGFILGSMSGRERCMRECNYKSYYENQKDKLTGSSNKMTSSSSVAGSESKKNLWEE